MIHCENGDVTDIVTKELVAAGKTDIKYHLGVGAVTQDLLCKPWVAAPTWFNEITVSYILQL